MSQVVWQGRYAAIKQRCDDRFTPFETYYDVWTWNVWKMKWTRMSQHGSGFTRLSDAMPLGQEENDKIGLMLARNAMPPEPL